MVNANKPYPITLPEVCTYGVDAWLREYQPELPASEYQAGYERLFTTYTRTLPTAADNPDLHACGIAEYKLPLALAQWWFELRQRRVLNRDHHDELTSAATPGLPHPLAIPPTNGHGHAWRDRLVMLRRNWQGHSPIASCFPGRHGQGGYLLGNPAQNELRAYVAEKGLSPVLLRPVGCLGAAPDPHPQDQVQAIDFADRFLSILAPENLADGEVFDHLFRKQFVRRFAVNLAWLRQGREILRRWSDGELLLTSVVHRPSRFLAIAWRSLGRQVTGFTHGNNYLTWSPAGMANSGAHLVCDRFVVSSAGEQLLVEHARQTRPTPFSSTAAITRVNTSVFRKAFTEMQARSPIREIRTVMVIGFSMDYQYYPWLPSYDTLTYAHLTLRLLQALREAGYRVIYKDHPDTIAETAEFFSGRADQVLTETFTKVIHQADCLFYVTPYSTTLGHGLLSRIPTVIVDNQACSYWHPEILALLQRRAALFPVAPDARGVLQFDPVRLKETVQSSLALTDPALVEKWAL